MRRFRFLTISVITIILACFLIWSESQATTLFEPGYEDSLVAVVGAPYSNHFGGLSVSDEDDIYVTGGFSNNVYRIRNGASSVFISGERWTLGVLVDGNTLYFGDQSDNPFLRTLYSVDLQTAVIESSFDVTPRPVSDIVKAPDGWGEFGGQLIIAGYNSGIYALDPSTRITTTIADPPGWNTSLTFNNDNQLIATAYERNSIVRVTSDGEVTTLVTFSSKTEAVRTHRPSGDHFVITADGSMYRVDSDTFTASLFANDFSVDAYSFPAPLGFSNDYGTLYYGTKEDAQYVIRQITGFRPLFADVPQGYWAEEAIYKIYQAGITVGCRQNPLKYCPKKTVTRAQMAVFLGRAIHGPNFPLPEPVGIFADVPKCYWAADWIEQFYRDGITKGCKQDPHDPKLGSSFIYYCPERPVTRTTMAIFLLRAKHGANYEPPPATGIFEDVWVNYWAADWIEQLYKEGITVGCKNNPLMYCPEMHVNRAQMAVFLTRMLAL